MSVSREQHSVGPDPAHIESTCTRCDLDLGWYCCCLGWGASK